LRSNGDPFDFIERFLYCGEAEKSAIYGGGLVLGFPHLRPVRCPALELLDERGHTAYQLDHGLVRKLGLGVEVDLDEPRLRAEGQRQVYSFLGIGVKCAARLDRLGMKP
jgi:hypothetical protein